MRLTKKGRQALALALAGNELKFFEVRIGAGILEEGEKPYEFTDLKEYKMTLPITNIATNGDGTFSLTAYLSNAELQRGFLCTEHGLFCYDPISGEPIMYAYRNTGVDKADFIASYTGTAHKNIFLTYICEIQDAENITATLDLSCAYINTEDFKSHVESAAPHPNTPTKLSDIETTDFIWSTDNDEHLHKISIDNLKKILRDAPAEEKINPAEELGLNSNLLFVEDFKSDDAGDFLKLKVTSCAENGVLIGIDDITNLKTGANYVISDGVNAEEITVKSVLKNLGGYYAKIENPLANSYKNAFLYRTTPERCNLVEKIWQGNNFGGVHANLTYSIDLKIDMEDIQGGTLIDGYFTLI